MKPRYLRGNNGQGMKWIRSDKRLAIYLRDGLACVYCGSGVEDEVKLTLDHIVPRSKHGSNDPSNLVTACHSCNTRRHTRSVSRFAGDVARYINKGATKARILAYIRKQTARPIDLAAARALMAKRGGFTQALNHQR